MTTDTPDWATSRATELFKQMLDEPMSNGTELVAEALREAGTQGYQRGLEVAASLLRAFL